MTGGSSISAYLYSFNLGTYLLIQLSMVAWTTSLISVHGNTVPIFLEYILYLCMLFVVVPNLFAAVACHYGIASAEGDAAMFDGQLFDVYENTKAVDRGQPRLPGSTR